MGICPFQPFYIFVDSFSRREVHSSKLMKVSQMAKASIVIRSINADDGKAPSVGTSEADVNLNHKTESISNV